jgi:hypothetical protein
MKNNVTVAKTKVRHIGHRQKADSKWNSMVITVSGMQCLYRNCPINNLAVNGVVVHSLVKVRPVLKDAPVASANSVQFRNRRL